MIMEGGSVCGTWEKGNESYSVGWLWKKDLMILLIRFFDRDEFHGVLCYREYVLVGVAS